MGRRFWVKAFVSVFSSLLFIAALWWPDWLEFCFGVDPDHGNGSIEWLIVALSAAATMMAFAIAGIEWLRTRAGRTVEDVL